MDSLISIVIITYNRKHLLDAVIRSISLSNYRNYEIIIIDDGSTDGTYQSLKEMIDSKKVRYFYQKNSGVSKARNLGVFNARGEYIAFIDSDIVCTEGWLSRLVDVAVNNTDIGILGAARYNKEYFKYKDIIETQKYPGGSIVPVSKLGMGASLVKREVFEKIGGFDNAFVFGLEDVELCLRANLLGYRVVYVYDAIVYHFHDRTKSARLSKEMFLYELMKNKIYVCLKLMNFNAVIIRVCKDIIKIFYYLFKDRTEAFISLRAMKWNIEHIKTTFSERKKIFRNIKISHNDLRDLERKEKLLDSLNRDFLKEVTRIYNSKISNNEYAVQSLEK